MSQLRDTLCEVHCFIDNDAEGRRAVEKAETEGLLETVDCSMTSCEGMRESEIEDLYAVDVYEAMVQERFGVSLESPKFRHSKKKWTERMQDTFNQQGKLWNDRQEKKLKTAVADQITSEPARAIHSSRRPVFDVLVQALEAKLNLRSHEESGGA